MNARTVHCITRFPSQYMSAHPSSKRIINFNESFEPQAPFSFQINNYTLTAFENEDFSIEIELNGNSLPESLYLIEGGRRIKTSKQAASLFNHTFSKIKGNKSFYLEGAGYQSKEYVVTIVRRPSMVKFDIQLTYPKYLRKTNEVLQNTGNLEVPQGTKAKWLIKTSNTD